MNNIEDYKIMLSSEVTEDGVFYYAEFREFDFCSGGGATPDEAVREARENLKIYIEEMEMLGETIPKPIDDSFDHYSGKFTIRLSKDLHKKAVESAKFNGVSLNSYVSEAIAEKIGGLTKSETHDVIMCLTSATAQFSEAVDTLSHATMESSKLADAINRYQTNRDRGKNGKYEISPEFEMYMGGVQ